MRLRKIPGIEERLREEYPHLVVVNPETYCGNWREYFEADAPLFLEIGMGRGRFIDGMRKKEPQTNFIAVEMRNEVIYDAAKKIGDDCKNVAFISGDAASLRNWFAEKEVDRIYLNFSDPWPKRAHRKRRLTHEHFLKRYREILKEEGELFVRTDAAPFFEFTLTEMTNHGFALTEVSLDYHNSDYFDGISTEYEEKKSKEGPIYYGRFLLRK